MNFFRKLIPSTNIWLYRISKGRLGTHMAGQAVLLLHSVGRKTQKAYVTPMNYYRDGDRYLVVASNWGQEHHPAWYHNLKHAPDALIEVDGRSIPVHVQEAQGEEYERLWNRVVQVNPFYQGYQQQTSRKIPILLLTPKN
jgi:deazaflavin-dependent oxidoreductase (nitroreductase family)